MNIQDKKMKITQSAFLEITKTIGSTPTESGGLLFGSRKDFVITRFLFDSKAITTASSYTFTTGYLNPIIKKWWEEYELELIGFIHSHPSSFSRLSSPDKKYFDEQFKNIPVPHFLTPLVFSAKDAPFEFIPLVYFKNGKTEKWDLEIVPDNYKQNLTKKVEMKEEVETKKEQSKTEVIKTGKEVIINLHNEVIQKSEESAEPVVIFVEREKEVEEKSEVETEKIIEVIEEETTTEKTILTYIYHGFLIGLLLFVFVMLLFLSPSIYNFFTNILN